MEEYFEIGQIVNTSGLKGIVKVKPFTDDIKRFEYLKKIYILIKNELKQFVIEQVRYNKNMVLLKLKGIDTIEEAEKYKNLYLKIHRNDAVKLEENSYFIVDIVGCIVYTEQNETLGKIIEVFSTKSNDIYVVKNEEGKQILLPAIKDVIKNVDITNKIIKVNLLQGLIED
ncbi:MAG: ribosome maturation factor RimM [Clostridia bacterium]|nr:ribosome maturation factor RimM [Clostridia bacterium]